MECCLVNVQKAEVVSQALFPFPLKTGTSGCWGLGRSYFSGIFWCHEHRTSGPKGGAGVTDPDAQGEAL
ncbi:hypothetical protein J4Q44_G00317350 [Coregonus suidteri]|uniref:Uncharacterized protein n=1 Tax=Coregonus suidteri TaxID=861788 RepID=A0AAN8KQZ1_9TELE